MSVSPRKAAQTEALAQSQPVTANQSEVTSAARNFDIDTGHRVPVSRRPDLFKFRSEGWFPDDRPGEGGKPDKAGHKREAPRLEDDHVSIDSSTDEDEITQNISRWKTETGDLRPSARAPRLWRALSNPRQPERQRSIQGKADTKHFLRMAFGSEEFESSSCITKQGALNLRLKESKNKVLSATIAASIKNHLNNHIEEHKRIFERPNGSMDQLDTSKKPQDKWKPKKLNIVIMVIGSRGDIQPFLKIAKVLKGNHNHRVRVATHPAFKDFVEEAGVEFFSVGGDPAQLMSYMVRNPGLLPSVASVRAGDIGKRRQQMAEMFDGFYRSCIHATDDPADVANMNMLGNKPPFVADAIIANPPSFAHIHCAEKLGIPMHLMFTMPWSPTQAFQHPLATIKKSNIDSNYANYVSYALVEMMIWQGLGDLINDLRVQRLGLEPVAKLWQAGLPTKLRIPFTYLFSPGHEIDVSGFVYLELASSFKPPDDLVKFLDAGPPPVYIGFGSIVVEDPNAMTNMIFDAIKKAGVRALVSKGWGGLGADELGIPEGVFMLGNIPHDWLFKRVSAVVHHGGAGTTAAALKFGRPSMIVPFFGDQPFWGDMVRRAGAGATKCTPYKKLTADLLATGIEDCLKPAAQENAQALAESIDAEGDGGVNAVASFHKHLAHTDLVKQRCSILPNRIAIWRHKKTPDLRLSTIACETLVHRRKIRPEDMRLIRHHEWNDFEGPGEPFTGGSAALLYSISNVLKPVVNAPSKVKRTYLGQSSRNLNSKRKDNASLANRLFHDATYTASKTASALANAPLDLIVALAQGLHNAPRLYGDKTIRKPTRITGISSGLRAARSEFAWGIHDGVSGLVEHPYRGARKHGVRGLVVGTGRGIGGFVLKDLAALVGPVAFTLKGVQKEIRKRKRGDPTRLMRRARIFQGRADWMDIPPERRTEFADHVLDRWNKFGADNEDMDVAKDGPKKAATMAHGEQQKEDQGIASTVEKLPARKVETL
ncbi:MAG: hypothetical protein M1814_006921 [Vezdaea aestivalis]|nr:MAG: hypothetical protein M1814_006921 [Vezdaea aestivalis]